MAWVEAALESDADSDAGDHLVCNYAPLPGDEVYPDGPPMRIASETIDVFVATICAAIVAVATVVSALAAWLQLHSSERILGSGLVGVHCRDRGLPGPHVSIDIGMGGRLRHSFPESSPYFPWLASDAMNMLDGNP